MTYFYHSVVDSPHLPRDLGHDSTQNMVVTLLGEFWRYSPSLTVPSAALVDLMACMDVSPAGARAALSRLLRKGTLEISRSGRTTAYSLTPAVAATIPASEILTMTFGQSERGWDGEWTVIVFSIPETQRDLRQSLRDWLRWLGFGPARDGVWISPHSDLELTKNTLAGLLPPDGLIFRSAHMTGTIEPSEVWPLAEIRDQYRAFIAELRPVVYRLRAGMVGPSEALKLSVSLLGRWRGFPTVDPDLPREYLPADWPRREARRLFVEVYDACIAPAAEHVRSIVRKYDPDAAAAVQGLTVAETIELYRTPAGGRSPGAHIPASALSGPWTGKGQGRADGGTRSGSARDRVSRATGSTRRCTWPNAGSLTTSSSSASASEPSPPRMPGACGTAPRATTPCSRRGCAPCCPPAGRITRRSSPTREPPTRRRPASWPAAWPRIWD